MRRWFSLRLLSLLATTLLLFILYSSAPKSHRSVALPTFLTRFHRGARPSISPALPYPRAPLRRQPRRFLLPSGSSYLSQTTAALRNGRTRWAGKAPNPAMQVQDWENIGRRELLGGQGVCTYRHWKILCGEGHQQKDDGGQGAHGTCQKFAPRTWGTIKADGSCDRFETRLQF